MKNSFAIGDIHAEPGMKARGFLSVPGTAVQMPVVVVNGVGEGPTLLVTAGIHGGEYPSIEAAIRFGRELDPAQISGQVIVMSPVNLSSFHARQAFVTPEDGKNLNRVFPGKARGTVAERMAAVIMAEVVPHIDAWVDLHGGDIPEALIPFVGFIVGEDAALNEQLRDLASAFGIEYLLHPSHLPGTTVATGTALGIPVLLAEAGQLGILDEENTELLLRGCRNVAQCLGILTGTPTRVRLTEFMDWPWVRAQESGCWYPAVKLGDMVRKDQVVGVVKDYFGEPITEYRAMASGRILLICAAMSVNPNDPLLAVAF